jgi:prepilin-type N-terminal cleavage/methylation domain-containing protein
MNRSIKQSGFTLIEMIVSLALFSVVVTIAVGALLVLISSNQRLQNEQSVMTNLSFALDSMTREIRTGSNYYCSNRSNYSAGGPNNIFDDGNNQDSILGMSTNDCETGRPAGGNGNIQGVSFVEAGNSVTGTESRILYFHERGSDTIYRKVGSQDKQSIISSGIVITDAEFYVTSSDVLGAGNNRQPLVTIYIEAKDSNDPTEKVYKIQTTVTQRTLDL